MPSFCAAAVARRYRGRSPPNRCRPANARRCCARPVKLEPVVTGKTALLRAQRRWADARGVRYDAHGCVRDLADNLCAPLVGATLEELRRGSELTPYATRPARLYSLASSAALVLNVFGPWRDREAS